MQEVIDRLNEKGFHAHYCETADEARELALSLVDPGQSVGIGGSVTIRDLGLDSALADRGHAVYWHWHDPARAALLRAQANAADVYMASSNAVTAQGDLINIDGTGNRVAGMFYGPDKVILIAGRNKIAANPHAAIARIKAVACPQNARRLGLSTPCATDRCTDCSSPQRMCRITVRMTNPPHGKQIHIILVNQDLGY
jgi:L-lactate utilization protein LutB